MSAPPIPELVMEPTAVQLFQFSAATWNAHRIHYDREYAREEGHPDVLVQSHLHGCFLLRALRIAVGDKARIEQFEWRNRGVAVPGDRLICTGRAAREDLLPDGDVRIEYELEERNQRGELCALGWAAIVRAVS